MGVRFFATKWPLLNSQPQSTESSWLAFPFHSLICRNTRRLWYFAAADVGGRTSVSTNLELFCHLLLESSEPELIEAFFEAVVVETNQGFFSSLDNVTLFHVVAVKYVKGIASLPLSYSCDTIKLHTFSLYCIHNPM